MKLFDPTRCEISRGISKGDLEKIVEDKRIKTLQFVQPLHEADIESLESIVFSARPDIAHRVYGHYSLTCDLSFLEKIKSVRRLYVDSLPKALGVEAITKLPKLKELWVEIFDLENFDFLYHLPPTITELGLGLTFSKKPSIASIERFKDLKYLYLESHIKGIEAVQKLTKLEKIVLRSISTEDLGYLEGLQNLWSVDIKLGGIKRFDSLSHLKSLKYLELWQIRGLKDLSFISEISSLQNLFIQSLPQVTKLPKFFNSAKLRRIYLENLKRLADLRSLEFAPALAEFVCVNARNQKPEDLLPVLRNDKVKRVLCGFGSHKKNDAFDELAQTYGKQKYSYCEFKYE